MNNRSIFEIVQVVTGLAVVAGLILVVLQLQQAQEIARKQQANVTRTGYDTVTMTEIGEVLPDALARACETPETLTGPDLVALNAYYLSHIIYVLYSYWEDEEEISSPISWRDYAHSSFDAVFLTAAGQAWWKEQVRHNDLNMPAELMELGNDLLESAPTTCYFDGWRDAITSIRNDA
jgi:hypothetical protein